MTPRRRATERVLAAAATGSIGRLYSALFELCAFAMARARAQLPAKTRAPKPSAVSKDHAVVDRDGKAVSDPK